MNKAELLIEQTISTDDPFTPTKLPTQPSLVNDGENEDFHKSQFLNFIGLIVFSISFALLWKYQIFGQTDFPWFVPAIAIFVCVWAIHYWVSIGWDVKDKFKKQRYYFFLHATLSSMLCLTLIISWTHEPSSPWFIYPVGCLFTALALHWTYVWCPKEWRWIVSQMFIYCILVTADFSLCYIKSDSEVIWLWIAVIYGGILVLQGFIYFLVTWMIPRFHKKEKNKQAAERHSILPYRLSPYGSIQQYESDPTYNKDSFNRPPLSAYLPPPHTRTNPAHPPSSSDLSFDAGASDYSGADVVIEDETISSLHKSSKTVNEQYPIRYAVGEIENTKYITITEPHKGSGSIKGSYVGSPKVYDIVVMGDNET